MSKAMDKLYKKLSNGENFVNMSIDGDVIEMSSEYKDMELPEGYQIINGIVFKDGVEIGRVKYVEKNVEEDFDDDYYDDDEDEYSDDEEEVVDVKPSLMDRFASAKKSDSTSEESNSDEDEDYDEEDDEIEIVSAKDGKKMDIVSDESDKEETEKPGAKLDNIMDIAKAIAEANPNVDFRVGNPELDDEAGVRFYASIPFEQLALPEGINYDKDRKDFYNDVMDFRIEDLKDADENKLLKEETKDEEDVVEVEKTKKRHPIRRFFQNMITKIKRFFGKGKYIDSTDEIDEEEKENKEDKGKKKSEEDKKSNKEKENKKTEDKKEENKIPEKEDIKTDDKKEEDNLNDKYEAALKHNEELLELAAAYEEKIKAYEEKIKAYEEQIRILNERNARLVEEIARLNAELAKKPATEETEESVKTEDTTPVVEPETTLTEEDAIRREIAELLFGKSDRFEANAAAYGVKAPFEGIENVDPLEIQYQMDDCDIDRFYELTDKLRRVSTVNNIRREIAELLIGKSDRFEANAAVYGIKAPFEGIENVDPLEIQYQMEDCDINRFYELKDELAKQNENAKTLKLSK